MQATLKRICGINWDKQNLIAIFLSLSAAAAWFPNEDEIMLRILLSKLFRQLPPVPVLVIVVLNLRN